MREFITNERRAPNDVVILDCSGKFTKEEGRKKLISVLNTLVSLGEKKVLLNFERVSHIDASGIGALVEGLWLIRKKGGYLMMTNLPRKVSGVLALTKMLTIFDIFDSEKKAVESYI